MKWINDTLKYLSSCTAGCPAASSEDGEVYQCEQTSTYEGFKYCIGGEVNISGKCVRIQETSETPSAYTSRVVLGQNITCNSWFAGGTCFNQSSD